MSSTNDHDSGDAITEHGQAMVDYPACMGREAPRPNKRRKGLDLKIIGCLCVHRVRLLERFHPLQAGGIWPIFKILWDF